MNKKLKTRIVALYNVQPRDGPILIYPEPHNVVRRGAEATLNIIWHRNA